MEVVEVIQRSIQGVTRPFVCRAADDLIYFVKGHSAGRQSLVSELLCGLLAKELGLPVPPFRVLEVPDALLGALDPEFGRDLGPGKVFGSELVNMAQELSIARLEAMDETFDDLCLQVFGFDLWVKNADRTLTRFGGNPNLLWSPEGRNLHIIDHNLAFSEDFSREAFFATHAFAKRALQTPDWVGRQDFAARLKDVLGKWPDFLSQVPDEWWFLDEERTVPLGFDPTAAHTILMTCEDPHFWDAP